MGIPYRQLSAQLSKDELSMYMAYEKVDPWGEQRDDLRSAITAFTIAKANGSKRVKIGDFMPHFEERSKARDLQEMETRMDFFMAKHNAKIKEVK